MKPIHCNPTITATIPLHLVKLRVTKKLLSEKGACREGLSAFIKRFPKGTAYPSLRQWLAEISRQDWENWALRTFGGDTATAGNDGTATAGNGGTATAGNDGTATAGYGGIVQIKWYDSAANRYRIEIGYIGENGLEASKKYKLNAQHEFELVP